MTELKRCPHCGSKAVYVHSMAYDWVKCGNMNCHNTATISVRYWNTRPIEDELNARIAQLEAERDAWKADAERLKEANEDLKSRIDDYRQDYIKVVNETNAPHDEIHCGCVPILRRENRLLSEDLANTKLELNQLSMLQDKYDILEDKYDILEKDYADVCAKRIEAADSFSKEIIELRNINRELQKLLADGLNIAS